MYYVKLQNGDSVIKVEITDENVFTDCPICGEETRIDIKEWLSNPDNDLCSTVQYCADCSGLMHD